jgi:hypothetical protein
MTIWVAELYYTNADGEDCDWRILAKTERAAKRATAEYIQENPDVTGVDSEAAGRFIANNPLFDVGQWMIEKFEAGDYTQIIDLANAMIEKGESEVELPFEIFESEVLEAE